MKTKMKYTSIHKQISGLQRELKKEQGFFDGRFVTISERDRTKYSRKLKHKNKSD